MGIIIYDDSSSGLTFGDLQNRVKTFGYGDADLPNIKIWLNIAYQEIATRFRWSWTQAIQDITLTVGNPDYSLSSLTNPIAFFGKLRPMQAGLGEPEYVDNFDQRQYMFMHEYADSAVTGQPQYFTKFANKLTFSPAPDAAYPYELHYWGLPFEMVNDDERPLIPAQYRNVLIMGAVASAKIRDNNVGAYAQYQNSYEGMIRNMIKNENMAQSQNRRTVALPAEYGNTYDRPGWRF